ncbi:Conserved_hypothetical protein [Hexamita inflata]|uniref:Uncharacterized protein n=2 Tax=Hexamita inflata TaxID=28002 RepID=A0AA86QME1_9EUKA|nr:Conserved hypothetical protein [Hexamita inflata]
MLSKEHDITMLNQSVSDLKSNFSQSIIDMQIVHQQQIQNMKDIISNLEAQINCTNNAGYVYVNNSCVITGCSITGQKRVNGICQCANTNEIVSNNSCICPQFSTLIGSFCICPINSYIVGDACICNVIPGQTMIAGICTCPIGQSVLNGVCLEIIVINGQLDAFSCNQGVYVQNFDILTLTNSVSSSNFSAGYVFASVLVIENAFIHVLDNVYTAVIPLFQSQSTFINLKIQIGFQTLSGGSLISSTSSSIVINKMNIISRLNSTIILTNSQLNIVSSYSLNANLSNLLINLQFECSNGNISLIGDINGTINIYGYQILGIYNSSSTVAMIGLNINSATVNVNQVSFKPSVFNVGNGSSYLFGSSIETNSIFVINNIAFIMGNIYNFLLLGSISTTNYRENYYYFGGIIAYINSQSTVSVNNVIVDSYQQITSSYVCHSGLFFGYILSSSAFITIQNICLQQNITSTSTFYWFGFIGWNNGNSSIMNASVTFSVQFEIFWDFGIVGVQYGKFAEIINLRTSVSLISNNQCNSQNAGTIFGYTGAKNCSVLNTSIIGGQVYYGSSAVGGFIGNLFSDVHILNSSIFNMSISGSNLIGGVVGLCHQTLQLTNTTIQCIHLLVSGNNVGIVVGNSNGTYLFSGSSSNSSYINEQLQTDCALLLNLWSAAGCSV